MANGEEAGYTELPPEEAYEGAWAPDPTLYPGGADFPAAPAEPVPQPLTTEQVLAGAVPPEMQPPAMGAEDPMAGAGMHRAFVGRPVVVGAEFTEGTPGAGTKLWQPGMPGYEEAARAKAQAEFQAAGGQPAPPPVRTGVTTVQPALQSDTDARARQLLGPQGAQLVQQLRAQGVPEAQIRQRLGVRTGPRVVGGVAPQADPGKFLPPDVKSLNPEPGFYLPGYREAVEQLEMDPKNKKALLDKYDEWTRTDPRAGELELQERGQKHAREMERLETDRAAAEQRELEAQRELAARQREKAELDQAEYQEFQANYDKRYQQLEADYAQAIEEVRTTKIDPRRGRIPILDALAMALGAAGAAFTKGPNFAQQIIQSRIDNDIKAQLEQLQGKKDVAAMRANRLGMLRQRLGDERAAIETERQLQLQAAKAYLAEKGAETKSELSRVDAQRYGAIVDKQLADSATQFKMGIQTRALMSAQERMLQRRQAMGAQAQQRRKARAQQLLAAQGLAGYRPLGKDEAQRIIPGIGIALKGSKVEDLRNEAAKFQGATRSIETMDRILKKYQGSDLVMSEDDKAAYKRAAAAVDVPTINKVAGASMTEGEMARIQPMLSPDATDAVGRQRYNMYQQMAAYKNQLNSSFQEKMGVHIERPVAVGVNPETGKQEYLVSEGVAAPQPTGAGGAQVMPGTAPK